MIPRTKKYFKSLTGGLRRRAGMVLRQIQGTSDVISRAFMKEGRCDEGRLVLAGTVQANLAAEKAILRISKFRQEKLFFDFDVDLVPCPPQNAKDWLLKQIGIRRYSFEVVLDMPWDDLPSSLFSIGMQIADTRCGLVTRRGRTQIYSDDTYSRTFCLFVEPSVSVWRIEYFQLSGAELAELSALAYTRKSHDCLCVIGEYTNTARDNGFALFNWIVEHAPDVEARYVIERKNIDNCPLGDGVVEFGSKEHLAACIDASVCAFTHHRGYVYPFILSQLTSKRYTTTRTLFLQHGITAMKRSVSRHYNQRKVGYDAVSVCSQLERNFFRKDFKYSAMQVYATGFPRYDRLYELAECAEASPGSILFFPTWRAGIEKLSPDEVREGDFFRYWSEAMEQVRASTGLECVLALHPMLERHRALFEPHVDRIAPTSELQPELVRMKCLLTDYSSVSFDALFLSKPVILFQFDQEEYGIREDAFIDIDTQLPGIAVLDAASLQQELDRLLQSDWAFKYQDRRDLFFDNCDNWNCLRTTNLIRSLALTSEKAGRPPPEPEAS